MCTRNEDHIIYGSRNIRCDRQNFQSFWAILCLLTPPDDPENKNFEKTKKIPGDVIILHKCVKNHNHATLFLRYNV